MSEPAVVVDGVSKSFRLYHERNQSLKAALLRGRRAKFDEFWALKDVSFEIAKGSTFGLIGENGSGKSTLLKCIAKILRPDSGLISTTGSLAALLELGSGFHPELSGRENVYLNASILGMRKSDIESKFDTIVDFSGIGTFIDQPVKNYSSGMYVRLGFSIAINVDPDVLLVDEVLAVGDANFQDKCMEKFAQFRRAGKTVVLVSHAMGSLRTMCDNAAWLTHGALTSIGDATDVVDTYIDTGHTERETAESGGSRWGSGEVRIDAVEILGSDGQPTTHLHTGDDVTMRLQYRTTELVSRPVFGFSMENVEGVYVWAHNTRDGGLEIDEVNGRGRLDLRIPRLMLQAGTFDLMAAVVDHTLTHTYDFVRDCLRFDVDSGHPRESGGIVALGGWWTAPVSDGPDGVFPTPSTSEASPAL